MKELKTEFGERVVLLGSGVDGLRMQLSVKATPDPVDDDLLTMVASDATLDRYDEVVQVSGWLLDNYQRNPVIQNAHQYGDIIFTIGKAEWTRVEGDALKQQWRFASAANPMAKVARDLYRGGFLNASSVGFVPMDWENGSEKTSYRRKYTKQELLEVSAVGIPANPNALALAVKSGAVEACDLKELYTLLKHFCKDKADPNTNAGPTGGGIDVGQLLQVRDQLKQLCKTF
jgi:HK97 family phage prohead protease